MVQHSPPRFEMLSQAPPVPVYTALLKVKADEPVADMLNT